MQVRAFAAVAAVLAVLCVTPSPVHAQQGVRLEFKDGRVSLNAQNAPIRAILAEWARLGGATIVNGERVAGAPVTLELVAVPERQALDIILRTVAAYMLAPRRSGSVGASEFDRILIMPTSNAPRNPTPPAPAQAGQFQRPLMPRPPIVQPPDIEEDEDDVPVGGETMPQIPQPRIPQPRVVQRPPQPIAPMPIEGPEPEDQPQPTVIGGTAPTAGNPFGVPAGSSMRPGVIAPVQPQQPNPNQRNQQP
jgi:hypothetical protein